jgi:hypothetical protein
MGIKVGRPRKFESNEQLIGEIESYFDNELDSQVTITGLAFHLGFCDRASFYDYEKRSEFSHTIKRARFAIAMSYEKALRSGDNNAGSIFGLKNIDHWVDKVEVDSTVNADVTTSEKYDMGKLSAAELDQFEELAKKARGAVE